DTSRTAIVVLGFAVPTPSTRPSLPRTRTGSPGATPSRPDAIAPEKIHGCPARTGRSRPGLRTRSCTLPLATNEGSALAAALLDEPDRADRHLAVDRLAHVVEREPGHRDGGERFHLD